MSTLIQTIETFGYLGIFIIVFLESFPLTFFLPGDSLLFAIGFLASQGIFSMPILIIVVFCAAVLGYVLSYRFGELIIDRFFKPDSKIFKKKYIDYTRDFYDKYGKKTLIIGRFVPFVRSISAALAGGIKMDYPTFIRYVVIGAAIWATLIPVLGFYLSRMIPRAGDYITPIIITIIFVSLLPSVWEYLKHRKNKNLSQNKNV